MRTENSQYFATVCKFEKAVTLRSTDSTCFKFSKSTGKKEALQPTEFYFPPSEFQPPKNRSFPLMNRNYKCREWAETSARNIKKNVLMQLLATYPSGVTVPCMYEMSLTRFAVGSFSISSSPGRKV